MIIICVIILLIIIALTIALVFAVTCSKKRSYSGTLYNNFTNANDVNVNNVNVNNVNDPSGWQLYLSTTCGHCIDQKKILNGFNTYAEYDGHKLVTNNINGKLYPVEKIKAFPFWYNTKTKATKLGKIELFKLSPKPLKKALPKKVI
jgi:hypothetical protein